MEREIVKEVTAGVIAEKEVVKVVETPVAPEEQPVKVLNWRASNAVSKLSPYTAISGYVGLISNHIFSRLLIADPHEQRFIPELAERWDVSEDGRSVTFYLRKNAFFHDGEAVTADDVNPDSPPREEEDLVGARREGG